MSQSYRHENRQRIALAMSQNFLSFCDMGDFIILRHGLYRHVGANPALDTRDFPCQYSDKENLWSRTPTSIMNSVIFFIFFSVFPLFKQDLALASLQRIIFVLIVISIDTYQNEIIFKDSRLKCHENINVQKNNIYFRYKHIYKNIYRYIDRYIIEQY